MIVKNDLELIRKCLDSILFFKLYRNIDVLTEELDEISKENINDFLDKLIIGED